MKLTLPPLGPLERVRLFVSYQRYGALLTAGSAAIVAAAIATVTPWLWVPLALLSLFPIRFGISVLGRWPRKLRATRIALLRIGTGRFSPASVKTYCGDPCFRVVAREILRRAGVPSAERAVLIAGFREDLRREHSTLVLIDHIAGTVITVGGDGVVRHDVIATSSPLERT